jgi:mycothiol S-conjugate amidase
VVTDHHNNPLRLLSVHAHPDDEASKGASLVARYRAEGVGATLVTATGGELGSVLNPAMDLPEVRDNLAAVRAAELAAATDIIGYDRVVLLGYRDSGMPDMEENADPRNFWNADLDAATGRLVEVIREDRPQVLVTYSDDQGGYPHPDHLRVHDISVLAFERAGDPEWYPELGDPWAPAKIYYSMWSKERILTLRAELESQGKESPYTDEWLDRFTQDHRITTRVDVGAYLHVRDQALLAHRTQVDPEEAFWFSVPSERIAEIYPWDDYILAGSRVDVSLPEDDLFAGLRAD